VKKCRPLFGASLLLCSGTIFSQESLENTLRWKTASEVGNFGFHIYRSKSSDGPFRRITDSPVAGAGTTDVPQAYHYTDQSIEPCTVYWYYIESIAMNGETEVFTPILEVSQKPALGQTSCAQR